jgi:hypothetical protein
MKPYDKVSSLRGSRIKAEQRGETRETEERT